MTEIEERIYTLLESVDGLNAGDCIRTHSGIYMNVFKPTFEMICIEDIAHALSNQCRFGGHLPVFYSVAQHSIECAKRMRQKLLERARKIEWNYAYMETNTKHGELKALMHDGSEAYLLDIPTPIKRLLSNYKEIEDGLMRKIAQKYGFEWPMDELMKEIDAEMLVFEWEHFVIKSKPLPADFVVLSRKKAKKEFLKYFYNL